MITIQDIYDFRYKELSTISVVFGGSKKYLFYIFIPFALLIIFLILLSIKMILAPYQFVLSIALLMLIYIMLINQFLGSKIEKNKIIENAPKPSPFRFWANKQYQNHILSELNKWLLKQNILDENNRDDNTSKLQEIIENIELEANTKSYKSILKFGLPLGFIYPVWIIMLKFQFNANNYLMPALKLTILIIIIWFMLFIVKNVFLEMFNTKSSNWKSLAKQLRTIKMNL